MQPDEMIAVSPRHSVKLAEGYASLINHAPDNDYNVRTLAHREVNGMQLMSAELVIAGRETRKQFPLAATYPLHFRKTYFPAALHGDPATEFRNHQIASERIGIPPPIGHTPKTFRGCFLPGRPYNRVSPFHIEPEENNIPVARELPLAEAAGLWWFLEHAFEQLTILHDSGFLHGDAELHNLVVCPAPLELLLIDFENSTERGQENDAEWKAKCFTDLQLILREAIFLQCALGRQNVALGNTAMEHIEKLFKAPRRFQREISRQSEVN